MKWRKCKSFFVDSKCCQCAPWSDNLTIVQTIANPNTQTYQYIKRNKRMNQLEFLMRRSNGIKCVSPDLWRLGKCLLQSP